MKHYIKLATGTIVVAILASLLWSVPYVFTVLGVTGWLFIGRLITIDDEFPGGWSNPDGLHPVPWGEVGLKCLVFLLVALASAFSEVRNWGG